MRRANKHRHVLDNNFTETGQPAVLSSSKAPCDDPIYRVHEAADRLKLPISSMYALAEKGEISFFRIGRLLRFRCSDLDAYIKSHRQVAK